MAVVTFDRKELNELVGRKLSDDTLKNEVPMIGCECEKLNEEGVEYEVFPDRPDLLSIEGFARALRYFLGFNEGLGRYEVSGGEIELAVDESVKSVRPHVSGAVLRGVELTDGVLRSLMQVQEKIHRTFGRERKKVSIGIHDLDGVEPPFTYRAADPDSFSFVPLEVEEEMTLREVESKHPKGEYVKVIEKSEKWPVIVDKNGEVLSFPPVINGAATEVTEKTEDLFIDVTGTDEEAVNQALNLVVTALAERGGEIEEVEVDGEAKPDLEPDKISVNLDYANKLLDMDLNEGEFMELVGGMGFGYSDGKVLIPPYRVDVMHPIDIVEDLAISHGYENFEPTIPEVPGMGEPDTMGEFSKRVIDVFVGFGFQEVMTPVLTNRRRQFERMELDVEEVAETRNALTENHSVCRKYLLPELMDVLKQNKHRSYPQMIFEVGDIVGVDGSAETGAKNVRRLAGAVSDERVNYADLASVLDYLMKNLGLDYELEDFENDTYIDKRAARIVVDGEDVGVIGETHPKVLENWGLEKPVVALELEVEALSEDL